jgi:hypothetical protein
MLVLAFDPFWIGLLERRKRVVVAQVHNVGQDAHVVQHQHTPAPMSEVVTVCVSTSNRGDDKLAETWVRIVTEPVTCGLNQ